MFVVRAAAGAAQRATPAAARAAARAAASSSSSPPPPPPGSPPPSGAPAAPLPPPAGAAAWLPPGGAAPPHLDADALLKRGRGPRRANELTADPYGWAAEDRELREAPLWMVLETEREERRLPPPSRARRAAGDRSGALLRAPAVRPAPPAGAGAAAAAAAGEAVGVGRRKSAVARVAISLGDGAWRVNEGDLVSAFPRLLHRRVVLEPLIATQALGAFSLRARVAGGGPSGRAGALRLGVARALAAFDPALEPVLRHYGLLERDPRVVERKKPGQPKARKRFQWVRR